MSDDKTKGLCILILIAAVGVLAATMSGSQVSEGYTKCICTEGGDGRGRVCQDDDVAEALYDKGIATEFSEFPDKGWSTTSPGDMDFPEAQYCAGQCSKEKGWVAWDFQDL